MNVYDFDKTLYRRDSSVDFYKWCLRNYPRTRLSLPPPPPCFLRYGLGGRG